MQCFAWVSVIMGLQVPTTGKEGVGEGNKNNLFSKTQG